ncbi:coiled-coil domain-containing protein 6 [Cricetulus griseus]|nr:coiled-coil domain-containing protein 6 [Cricetulus griseus]
MQSSCSATSGGSGGGGGGKSGGIVISPFRLEELTNRLASLQQENKVLKIELETYKLKCKALQEENRDLRKASVTIVPHRLIDSSLCSYGSVPLMFAVNPTVTSIQLLENIVVHEYLSGIIFSFCLVDSDDLYMSPYPVP